MWPLSWNLRPQWGEVIVALVAFVVASWHPIRRIKRWIDEMRWRRRALDVVNSEYESLRETRQGEVYRFFWAIDRGEAEDKIESYRQEILSLDKELKRLRENYKFLESCSSSAVNNLQKISQKDEVEMRALIDRVPSTKTKFSPVFNPTSLSLFRTLCSADLQGTSGLVATEASPARLTNEEDFGDEAKLFDIAEPQLRRKLALRSLRGKAGWDNQNYDDPNITSSSASDHGSSNEEVCPQMSEDLENFSSLENYSKSSLRAENQGTKKKLDDLSSATGLGERKGDVQHSSTGQAAAKHGCRERDDGDLTPPLAESQMEQSRLVDHHGKIRQRKRSAVADLEPI